VHVLFPLGESLGAGAGVSGILHDSEDYQVVGAYGLGRASLWSSGTFEWGAFLGVGVGTNAPILHSDLQADAPLLPFGTLGTEVTWRLNDRLRVGLQASDEQLSVVHVGAQVSVDW
jgi:hypothetical protein